MADKKISALTAASTPLAGTEVLPIVQSGSTVKVAVSDLTAGRSVSVKELTASQATTYASNFFQNASSLATGNTSTLWVVNGSTTLGASDRTYYLQNVLYSSTAARFDAGYWNGASYLTCFSVDGPAGDFTLSRGNFVPSTAAKGINFTANTSAAGMTSQLLNWYEEGTWTPVIVMDSGTSTGGTFSGAYTRVGRMVTVTISANVGTVASTPKIDGFSGLPFAAANINELGVGALREAANTGAMWQWRANKNATTCLVRKYDNGQDLTNGDTFVGTLTYFTA